MKRFIVSDLGSTPVTLDNGAFMFCKDLGAVKRLEVDQTISVVFESGRGSNRCAVTRVGDGDKSPQPIGGTVYCSQCGSLVCGHERA